MSLVNDMLRDLDQRKRSDKTAESVVVGTTNKPKQSNVFIWIVVILLVGILSVAFVPQAWLEQAQTWIAPNRNPVQATSIATLPSDTPQVEAKTTQTAPVEASTVVPNAEDSAQKPEPVKVEIPTPLTIEQINWQAVPQVRGGAAAELTFWLAQSTAFVVYYKSEQRIELGLAATERPTLPNFPDELGGIVTQAQLVEDEQYYRFVIETSQTVRFDTALKQNPTRFVVTAKPDLPPAPVRVTKTDTSTKPAAALVTPKPEVANTVAASTESKNEPTESASTPNQPQASNAPVEQGTWRKSIYASTTDAGAVREAKRFMSRQEITQAISVLSEQVERAPKSVQSRYLLAQLLLATEQYPLAQQAFAGAPNNLSWGLLKARYYLQMGQAGAAIQTLNRYPQGAQRADYIQLLAAALQQQGQHKDAVDQYVTLLAMDPNQASAWNRMAVSLEHLGRRDKAIAAYQNALKVESAPASERQFAASQVQRLYGTSTVGGQ
jgi:tetratricopeptide (TPR) repeat protein